MSEYEPIYFSRAYAWLNDVNITDEEYEKRSNDMNLFEYMWYQLLQECDRRNIEIRDVRQSIVKWLFTGAYYDQEWLDFDNKVRRDTLQKLKQEMTAAEQTQSQ